MDKFPKVLDELRDAVERVIKRDNIIKIKDENVAEYNEDIYKISDNIETTENKRIVVFSSNPDIAKNLSRLNKAIVIKHNMLDMMPALINEHGEIEILASLNLTGNDSTAIYCDDKLLSDFMLAFMRMHGVMAYCNPLGDQLKLEDSGKKLIHIDIPSNQKNNLSMFIDGMASFLDGGLYLFDKKLYASREEWEQSISIMLRSMLSNISGTFKTITPKGINYVVSSTMAKVDPRHMSHALSVAKNIVDDIKGKAEVSDKKAEMAITKEKKGLQAEKTQIRRQMLLTEKTSHELQEERDFIENSKTQLERKVQKLESSRLEIDNQEHELEKALAEFKEKKARYREEKSELEKIADAVKNERHGAESELLKIERLKEELEKKKREILGRRLKAETAAMESEEQKTWIDEERLRLEELLGKLDKEKAEVDAKKADLEGLRERVKLKRKMRAKAKLVKKVRVKKSYKTTKLAKMKMVVKAPIRVKGKEMKKHYKIKKPPASRIKIPAPKPEETKPMLAESILEPNVQNIGFSGLKSKLDRYEPIHKRKRLGARILEKKKTA